MLTVCVDAPSEIFSRTWVESLLAKNSVFPTADGEKLVVPGFKTPSSFIEGICKAARAAGIPAVSILLKKRLSAVLFWNNLLLVVNFMYILLRLFWFKFLICEDAS